jgi:hypothetical protein
MKRILVLLALICATSLITLAEDKGHCPPAPQPPDFASQAKTPPPADPDKTYVGAVSVFAVISDKGFVCRAQVIHGVDKETDSEALSNVRARHFKPATKNGRPVVVTVRLDLHFWRDKNGQLVTSTSSAH